MGAGDPPSTILIDGVLVEVVEEFIYLCSKQSSNGYCRPDVLRRIWLACSVMNSLEGVEMQLSKYQHQSTPVPSTGNVCPALWCRNMDPLGCRHEDTGGFSHEVSARDTYIHTYIAIYMAHYVDSTRRIRGAGGSR